MCGQINLGNTTDWPPLSKYTLAYSRLWGAFPERPLFKVSLIAFHTPMWLQNPYYTLFTTVSLVCLNSSFLLFYESFPADPLRIQEY